MSETYQFNLPLIAAAQAQKHVTVNEALSRLDAAAQLRLKSVTETVPPVGVVDGVAYAVPAGAVNDWNGHAGQVAVFANGGWVYLTPVIGWAAWVEGWSAKAVFDGSVWRMDAVTVSPGGAITASRITEFDHILQAGTTSVPVDVIPANEVVIAVTSRVLTAISGTNVTGWQLGIAGNAVLFGDALGLSVAAGHTGMTGTPQSYSADTPFVITAIGGGSFSQGAIRIAVHSLAVEPPGVV